jgi:hypothetical protein
LARAAAGLVDESVVDESGARALARGAAGGVSAGAGEADENGERLIEWGLAVY